MTQQPDNLFREKLANYQRPAPTLAWDKISTAQKRKKNNVMWTRFAASLIPLCIAGYLLWPEAQPNNNAEVQAAIQEESPLTKITPEADLIPSAEVPKHEPVAANVTNSTPKKEIVTIEEHEEKKTISMEPSPGLDLIPTQRINTDAVLALKTEDLLTSVPEVEPTPRKPQETMTLVFTAKEVDNYLDKKNIAKATSDTKKSSTLMKLLKKANNLTSNQDPLGELRQKKSEILALNFKNDKQRGQNK